MQSGRERRSDVDDRRLARHAVDAHSRPPAFESGRHERGEPRRRGVHDAGRRIANAHLWQARLIDWEIVAFDGDAAALDSQEGIDGGDAGGWHGGLKSNAQISLSLEP